MRTLSDGEWIYIVLAVFYLSEMVVWVRPRAVAFVSSWGALARRTPARRITGNEGGQLILGGLAPFDFTLLAETLPVSMGRDGAVSFVAASPMQADRPSQPASYLSWQQLTEVTAEDRSLRVADAVFCTTRSEATAGYLADQLRTIATAEDTDERASRIERLRNQQFDVAAVRERLDQWNESTLATRVGATLMLLWIGPVGLLLLYQPLPWLSGNLATAGFLAVLFVLWWSTAAATVLAHAHLYPDDRSGRWKVLAYNLLSPAVPLRAADALSRRLFHYVHPLTVSAAIDSPARFRQLAADVLRDAAHPQLPEQPDDLNESAKQVVCENRQQDDAGLSALLRSQGVDAASLLSVPAPEDDQSASYCPRCRQEFASFETLCEPCGNRPTIAF